MKFLIYAPYSSFQADRDADLLTVLGPYEAKTLFQLSQPDYPLNSGRQVGGRDLRDNVVAELLNGAYLVIHPELTNPELSEILLLLTSMKRGAIQFDHLQETLLASPSLPNKEVMDSLNTMDELRQKAGIIPKRVPVKKYDLIDSVIADGQPLTLNTRRAMLGAVHTAVGHVLRSVKYVLKPAQAPPVPFKLNTRITSTA